MGVLTEEEEKDVQAWIQRVLSDTGALCRNLLGMDYDEDDLQQKTCVGTGGVRAEGSHQKIVDLLDDPLTKFKLIEAPRGSYKSSILQGYCVKNILLNPDIRIFYIARTDAMALEKSIAIRAQLKQDRLTELFGNQEGDKWEEACWTVAGRKNVGLMNATFSVWSMDSLPTGGRADIVILDDFIDDTNCTNTEQIKKSMDSFTKILPFIAKGGVLVVVGTRWEDGDLYSELEGNPLFKSPNGDQLILGAGVEVVRADDGSLDLKETEEGLTFPHLSLDMLRTKLHGMSLKGQLKQFYCQYLNTVPASGGTMWKRRYFKPLQWAPDMNVLSGYLLTDTAVSQKDEGCHSVVAYVGLDASDNIYVLDVRVGHFQPNEFVNIFFDVLETWQQRVNHVAEVWESIALATVFRHAIDTDSRSRKIKTKTIEVNRYTGDRKDARIMRLLTPMMTGRFWVVNTVPKTYEDFDGTRMLFDPEGFYDARTKTKQPAGELVDQFLRFPAHPKKDIADTFGLILEYEKKNHVYRRHCVYKPFTPKVRQGLTEQRKSAYHAAEYGPASQGDWWDRTLGTHGF